MFSFLSPRSLARVSARRPWLVLALWLVVIVGAGAAAMDMKIDEAQTIKGSESQEAEDRLEEIRGEDKPAETVVVQSTGVRVDEPAYTQFISALTGQIRETEHVLLAVSYLDTGDEAMVSADRTKTIISVVLEGDRVDAADNVVPLLNLLEEQESAGFDVTTAGDGSISHDTQHQAEKDLLRGEMIGIPAALIILLIVFGAAVAAGVPVVLGFLGIVVAAGITAVISRFFGVSSIVMNMITMIGLAVGIDYTLFIVERFREERARGIEKVQAVVNAGDTASRAVLFSGITVIIAMASMFIVPASVFQGLAIGAITVVIASVALALTALPAVLSLLGDRINWLHLPGRGKAKPDQHEGESGFFGRTTAAVTRHPVLAVVAASGLLIAAAVPVVTINLGSSGLDDMPAELQSTRAFKVLDRDFSAGRIYPAEIVIDGDIDSPAVQRGIEDLRAQIASDEAFAGTQDLQVSEEGDLALLPAIINGDAYSQEALDAVDRLRDDYVPAAFDGSGAEVFVGGGTAGTTDYIDTMNRYLPIVIGFVLALSFVLLLLVFRSVVIPLKAILMNLLSVGAAYGLIVLVFQHGFGADLAGFQQSDVIAAYLPIFLFAVLFGLSMDYHVFLLTRIQERFQKTADNSGSVSYGLRSTAHIITGAAAIMMMVFGGFALGDMAEIQQTGFGLAVAVLIDATIVRSILVPASMELLGEKNWYLPKWLEWLPRINVEGPAEETAAPAPVQVPAWELVTGAGGD